MNTPVNQEQLSFVRGFIMLVGDQIKKTTNDFESACDISHQELTILTILMQHEALMVKEIANDLQGVSLSTLTRLLDNLETKGYIKRNLDPNDRRSFLISMTDKGIEALQFYGKHIETIANLILEPLTATERTIFLELLRKIETYLSE